MVTHADILVIGTGVAGLSFALEASKYASILLVSKRSADESNTKYAQGGIAAVLDSADSFAAHVNDTMVAGAGLNHRDTVELCVKEAPDRIRALLELGTELDRDSKARLSLHLEGGHSARRIVHAQDMTGREVERALLESVRQEENIELWEDHTAVDLIMAAVAGSPDVCVGAYVLDSTSSEVRTVVARSTVLATGGAGKVYLYTTNPDVATGDGVAMAYRAGAEVANMEFYQFHPTCLFHPNAKNFLISEALRGEGAVLKRVDGTPFMQSYDERGDLAPRDVVARAIDAELKRTGADHVNLDITHRGEAFVKSHFPNIHAECLAFGIDIAKAPIPVVPAAHYMCGGVSTDLHGRTTVPGLWAIGECAHTGLHGANRLASNSLLEGLVFGHRAALALQAVDRSGPWPDVKPWDASKARISEEAVVVSQNWDELRRTMWNYVGIVRSNKRLKMASRRLALLQEEISEYYWNYVITRDLLELRNIATVAQLIVDCASARKESRGLHSTVDYPATDAGLAHDTVVKRGVAAHLAGM